ncbi:hypothetical protein PHMEG_0005916 [Phytophthora megakarya]|uniref:Transmembrane protein n=1 Tax=Phytophthora megakarya TaxID=4795 RepID=A0A225WQ48_9STRA|nr:hypothetical protein PHMEG_0005916 [Phytophthora megakarya]
MGTRFRAMGIARKLTALALLVTGILTTTQAAQQSASQLRGWSKAVFIQQQRYSYNEAKSVVSYRRLVETAAASDKANEVGASVRKAIKQLRGGNDKFYQDLITAIKITMCTKDSEVRFVSCTADNAYLDDNGDPVKLTITTLSDSETVDAYNQGQCEVMPNCYWAPIVAGDVTRAKVYADADSTMTKSDATAKLKQWATGVIGFVIPGIVLGVLSLLTMFFFLICRCCCNRCGGRYPREEGYTCMQKFLPLLFFFLFSIGVVVVSAAAFLYRGTMLTAVDHIFNYTSGTLDNASLWIVDIRDPLVDVGATVIESAADITTKLNGTDFINDGLTNITTELNSMQTDCNAHSTLPKGCTVDTDTTRNPNSENIDKDGKICIPCDTCTAIGTQAGAAATQIDKNAGPGVKQLGDVKSQLNTKLVEISGTVQSAVLTAVSTANDLTTTVDETQDKVNDYDKKFQSYRDQLGYAIMGLFALALVVIVIGFIGIFFGLTPLKVLANIMHIAYFLGFIALILTFIISAIVLAIGVLLGDACEMTAIFANNWTVPLGESAKALDACFQNESLIDVFNLSDKLAFARGGIDFPDLDMDKMFDFSDLDTFATQAKQINGSAFEFNPSIATQLTGATGANCKFSDFMREQFDLLVQSANVKNDIDDFVTELHSSCDSVTTSTNTFESKTKQLNTDIDEIKTNLDSSLIKDVGDFEDAMYCTFIADGFWQLYGALCSDLMPAITMIALMLFLCGIFLIPVNVCLIIGVKRLKAHGNGHIMDTEMKFK